MEQINGKGPPQAQQVPQKRQQEQHAQQGRCLPHASDADGKAELHRNLYQLQKQQQNQLAKQNARRDAAGDHHGGAQHRLPEAQGGDVPLFQTQNVVEPQFLLPPLYHKAVGVQQQHRGKQRHHKAADEHHGLQVGCTPYRLDDLVPGQEPQNVIHGGQRAAGEEIRAVIPAVAEQIYQSQPGKEAALTHGSHRLGSAPSGCRRSGGTGPPGSRRPGRAGDTPGRPAGTAPAPRGWRPSRSGSPSGWSARPC